MRIDLKEITIRELFAGYKDEGDIGSVVGFSGLLNIRPAYQREFVYDDKKRNAVIQTVKKGFPLNVMYWAICDDGTYELLDGQQRTISICRYVEGSYSVDGMYFHNLTQYEQDQILDYKLMVYVCEGTDNEKLDWFEIINIAGLELKPQELRNAIYTGPWLSDAKRYFSKANCPAEHLGKGYIKGDPKRQDLLEIALRWISEREGVTIREYMGKHQHDPDARELKDYFEKVVYWVKDLFPKPKKNEMEGLAWGSYFNEHGTKVFDKSVIASRVEALMKDKDVTQKKGIFRYLLDNDERHLHLRAFDDDEKLQAYTRQGGICPRCQEEGCAKIQYNLSEMEADHIVPWSKGGKTISDNCQMLCRRHNGMKSNH